MLVGGLVSLDKTPQQPNRWEESWKLTITLLVQSIQGRMELVPTNLRTAVTPLRQGLGVGLILTLSGKRWRGSENSSLETPLTFYSHSLSHQSAPGPAGLFAWGLNLQRSIQTKASYWLGNYLPP